MARKTTDKPGDRLDPREYEFCRAYVIIPNGTKAAIAAGWSPKSADSVAVALLKRPLIQAEIARLQHNTAEAAGVTAAEVAREYMRLGRADMRDFFEWTPRGIKIKSSAKLTEDQARAVRSVTDITTTTIGEDGKKKTTRRVKVELHDKKGALDSACRQLGFNAADKADVVVTHRVDGDDATDAVIRAFEGLQRGRGTPGDGEPGPGDP